MGTLFSGLSALVVEDMEDGGGAVVVTARTRDAAVPCPVCGMPTAKVHGYHHRTVTDVPVDGRQVVVHLRVRRPVCPIRGCRRQTLREQIPGLLERHQRRTVRLAWQISQVARESCGRAATRLAGLLAARRPHLRPGRPPRPGGVREQTTRERWNKIHDLLSQGVGLPHLRSLTNSLEIDRPAVHAGLTLPYHNGGTEGVNS